ncbi:Uncharacterized protein dnm_024850 [Desulfonema magnum]|uniref:Uncharacterized protein n=1 Tax=Desulfonema magnum TaxID=45655 RepID=A0A975BJL3_9BACT|nr:Uncharacterized protein dnm_024850 [Desulfonema magnum]
MFNELIYVTVKSLSGRAFRSSVEFVCHFECKNTGCPLYSIRSIVFPSI